MVSLIIEELWTPPHTMALLESSKGTVIGVDFVNMFPDRVGRILVDGVAVRLSALSP